LTQSGKDSKKFIFEIRKAEKKFNPPSDSRIIIKINDDDESRLNEDGTGGRR
jgi:hypothetical protein